jgi:hypothetical protein
MAYLQGKAKRVSLSQSKPCFFFEVERQQGATIDDWNARVRRERGRGMGWLPWKKKKSQLEEKDRQRNVPPLLKDGKPVAGQPNAAAGGAGSTNSTPKSDAPKTSANSPLPAQSTKMLPDDAILTPCYRGDVETVRELLSGRIGRVSCVNSPPLYRVMS